MVVFAYLCSVLSFLTSVGASMVKGTTKKQMGFILGFIFLSNFFAGVGYLASGAGFNGAVSCMLGAIISVVNFSYGLKNIPIPKVVLGIYFVAFFVANIFSGTISYLTFIAIAATYAFVIGLAKKDGKGFRFWKTLNNLLWLIYDILAKSYNSFILHMAIMMFNLISSFIYDRKKRG